MLILDIDSSSLAACIVETGEVLKISKTKRVELGSGAVRDAQALMTSLKEALPTLLKEYTKDALGQVHVVLASPWFDASVKTLTSKSEKQSTISHATVERVVSNERAKSQSPHPIESMPITVTVNGYRTRVAKPLSGTAVAITVYESHGDSQGVEYITGALHTEFPKATIDFHTTPIVYGEALMRLIDDEHGILVDVGGELSDITIFTKRSIGHVGFVSEGSRSIARTIAGSSGSLADVQSRLAMLARQELAPKDAQVLMESVQKSSEAWQKGLGDAMVEAGKSIPIPHHIFLVGEREELEWLTLVLASGTILDATHIQRSRAPTVLNADFFKNVLSFGEDAHFDSSLALDALFFHMTQKHSRAESYDEPVLYSLT